MKSNSVSTIVGPWQGDASTGLMQRCRDSWEMSLSELSDLMVATFLNQQIAVVEMLEEAESRLKRTKRDDTEYFEGQLLEALTRAKERTK
jgi:hypothetical protein